MPRPQKPEEEHAVKMSVSFTQDQMRDLLNYCQKNERPISWVIRKALEEWLPKHMDDHV